MSAFRMHGPARLGLTAVFAGLLAGGTVAVVTGLHVRADRQRQAQVQLSKVETVAERLTTVPLVALYVSPERGVLQLSQSRRSIDDQLTALARKAPSEHLQQIRQASTVFADDLKGILALITPLVRQSGPGEALLRIKSSLAAYAGIERRFQQEYNAIVAATRATSADYGRAASRASLEAYTGSALAILLGFITFLVMLRSLARARRRSDDALARAEQLAVENERLLASTRIEAETDELTGLANRRKLLNDLDRGISALTDGERLLLAVFDLDGFKHYNDQFGHPAGDQLLIRLGRELAGAVAERGTAYRLGGDEFCTVYHLQGDETDAVMKAATSALCENGNGFSITSSHGTVVLPLEARSAEQAFQLADQRLYANKTFSPLRGPRQARDVLVQALAERKDDLGAHLTRVANLSEFLAKSLSLPEDDIARIRLAAELHDIGKVAIPESIIDKPGPLTDEEWLLVKQHTLIGERIVGAGSTLQDVAQLIRASHERFDGDGYPDGLAGGSIPLGSRIITVCDAYDAMLSERPYRPAKTGDEALAELEHCAGARFDPTIVAAFTALARADLVATEIAA